ATTTKRRSSAPPRCAAGAAASRWRRSSPGILPRGSSRARPDSARADSVPGISGLIVNWNARDHLEGCLASLYTQEDRQLDIIVLDSGSHDGSAELVRRAFPAVKLVETGENLGFAEGCNRGIREATAPWIFVLNNDTRLDKNAIAELRAAA